MIPIYTEGITTKKYIYLISDVYLETINHYDGLLEYDEIVMIIDRLDSVFYRGSYKETSSVRELFHSISLYPLRSILETIESIYVGDESPGAILARLCLDPTMADNLRWLSIPAKYASVQAISDESMPQDSGIAMT